MVQTYPNSSQSSWQGSLRDLTRIVTSIRHIHAFGRLTLRNTDRISIAHVYFHNGKLAHIVGSSGEAEATLRDLHNWTHAVIRFERGATATGLTLTDEQESSFDILLLHFQKLGLVEAPTTPRMVEAPGMPRVVEGEVVSMTAGEQLLTPHEWQILIESTRRVSLAVAHVVGARQAPRALRTILDDCSETFPAVATLQVVASGHMQITESSHLDRMPRTELLAGFHALFVTCQRFCSFLVGERDAHRLIIQALGDLCLTLVGMGVFQINNGLLATHKQR